MAIAVTAGPAAAIPVTSFHEIVELLAGEFLMPYLVAAAVPLGVPCPLNLLLTVGGDDPAAVPAGRG